MTTAWEFAITPRFDWVRNFSGGLAAVQVDDTWGFIDKAGAYVIDLSYPFVVLGDTILVSGFSGGLAGVGNVDAIWGYIDRTGILM